LKKVKEMKFDRAMMDIYRRAKDECNYNATRYLKMLLDHGGLKTAKILINASNVSDGYTALWERKRLDLTVEALILNSEWDEYFTDEERTTAKKRLIEYKYNIDAI
jgi:hypothetical protein